MSVGGSASAAAFSVEHVIRIGPVAAGLRLSADFV